MEPTAQPAHDPSLTTPKERVWEINAYLPTKGPGGQPLLLPDPGEVERAMSECGAILSRIGGIMQLATVREEIHPGQVVTTKILVRWQSFVPVMQGVATPAPAPPDEELAEAAASNGDASA